jgi:WD40 repeat protein
MATARATDDLTAADDLAAVAFDRVGGSLAAPGRWSGVYVFDRAHAPNARQVPAGAVRCAALAPAGPGLATGGSDGVVQLWDRNSLARRRALAAHRGAVLAVAYSPDGRRLVTGGEDGSVRVWDVTTGDDLLTFVGRAGPVTSIALSADGRTIASGTAGGERPPEVHLRRAAAD